MNSFVVLALIATFAGAQAGNLLAAPVAIGYAATPFTYKSPGLIAEYPTYQVNSPLVQHVPSSHLAPRIETYGAAPIVKVAAAPIVKTFAAPAIVKSHVAYAAPAVFGGPYTAPNPTLFL